MNPLLIRFLEIGRTDPLFREHFFKGYPEKYPFRGYFFEGKSKGNPFWRCFFEECQIMNVFRGYFFGGESKGNPF